MKRGKIILIGFIIILFANQIFAQETKFKTYCIYNFFMNSIGWPNELPTDTFLIGILGNSPVYKELMEQPKKKNVVIKKFVNVKEVKECEIIFISFNKSVLLPEVLKQVGNRNTLIITEKEGMIQQGSGINFVVRDEKMRFELKKANLQKQKLQVSKQLEKLAILIN